MLKNIRPSYFPWIIDGKNEIHILSPLCCLGDLTETQISPYPLLNEVQTLPCLEKALHFSPWLSHRPSPVLPHPGSHGSESPGMHIKIIVLRLLPTYAESEVLGMRPRDLFPSSMLVNLKAADLPLSSSCIRPVKLHVQPPECPLPLPLSLLTVGAGCFRPLILCVLLQASTCHTFLSQYFSYLHVFFFCCRLSREGATFHSVLCHQNLACTLCPCTRT